MKDNKTKNEFSNISIENDTNIDMMLTKGINSFIFNDNNSKNDFIEFLLSKLKQNRIRYVDLDTSFRAKQRTEGNNIQNIELIMPKAEDVQEAFNYILSNFSNEDTIIIDSINIVPHLFNSKDSFSKKCIINDH